MRQSNRTDSGTGPNGAETYLEVAQDRLHAAVEAALTPLPVSHERVRQALEDRGLAWPDAIRGVQYGCPRHSSSYTIGGFELFVDDHGRPHCTGGCSVEKVLEALGIDSEQRPSPPASPPGPVASGWRAQVPPGARRAA